MSPKRFHDPASRFPLRGPGRSGSPASTVLSGCYDFLSPVPPHFVSFAWQYHGRILCSLRVTRDARVTGRGPFCYRWARPNSPFFPWRRQDLPSSCETPMTCLHMLFDSGGTDTRLAMIAAAAWPPLREPRGLLQGTFEAQSHGFQARCLRFAVRVSPTPRKTRFRPLARRYRAGFSPAGSQRKVSATHACSHPPFAGLTWRDPVFRSRPPASA